MKKQSHPVPAQSPRPIRTLDASALETVHGGEDAVAPRDPATGLPTGKRGYQP
jgi:hypothetical protein